MLSLIFITLTLLSVILFYYGNGKDKRVLLLSSIWLIIVGTVAYTGYFENTSTKPPRFLMVLFAGICLSIYFYKRTNQNKINPLILLAIHMLRLPVELVLYHLFLQKQVPVLMTFKGWNFDIIIGISATLILLYLLLTQNKLHRIFILLWNISGLIFLMTIVVIAILSSPLPIQQFAFTQPNIAVLKFPYVFLPAYIVPLVFLSHMLTINRLLFKTWGSNDDLCFAKIYR